MDPVSQTSINLWVSIGSGEEEEKTSNNDVSDDGSDDQVHNNSKELEDQDGSIIDIEGFREGVSFEGHAHCATPC